MQILQKGAGSFKLPAKEHVSKKPKAAKKPAAKKAKKPAAKKPAAKKPAAKKPAAKKPAAKKPVASQARMVGMVGTVTSSARGERSDRRPSAGARS